MQYYQVKIEARVSELVTVKAETVEEALAAARAENSIQKFGYARNAVFEPNPEVTLLQTRHDLTESLAGNL